MLKNLLSLATIIITEPFILLFSILGLHDYTETKAQGEDVAKRLAQIDKEDLQKAYEDLKKDGKKKVEIIGKDNKKYYVEQLY